MNVRPCTPQDAELFLEQPIRKADLEEWRVASGGEGFPLLLRTAVSSSASHPRALLNDAGDVLAIWGVSGVGRIGYVWLVASVAAERLAWRIHHHFKREVAHLQSIFPILIALTHDANPVHHRWLEVCGFKRAAGAPKGDFLRYVKGTPGVL